MFYTCIGIVEEVERRVKVKIDSKDLRDVMYILDFIDSKIKRKKDDF